MTGTTRTQPQRIIIFFYLFIFYLYDSLSLHSDAEHFRLSHCFSIDSVTRGHLTFNIKNLCRKAMMPGAQF